MSSLPNNPARQVPSAPVPGEEARLREGNGFARSHRVSEWGDVNPGLTLLCRVREEITRQGVEVAWAGSSA